jgi:hypothetical protein
MKSDSGRFDDSNDSRASYDGSDPARRLLRELPILRLPDDALESVWDATVRTRTVAGKWRALAFAAAAAGLLALVAAKTVLDRETPVALADPPVLSKSPEPDVESISRAELGVRFAFGVTERTLERFAVLHLLKTTFSSDERKR